MNKKLLSKVFTTTLIMFFLLTVYTIPTLKVKENVLRTNLEIEDVTNIPTTNIYLLDSNNLLVQTNIFINSKEPKEIIKQIIEYLIINNKNTPVGLKTYIPKDTKILSVEINNNLVVIDFSEELLNTNNLDIVITGIVYSIINIDEIDNIKITIDSKPISGYNETLNKDIGINKEYSFTSRNNIEKAVIYYLNNINNNYYYVPVTKYLNDTKDKINIIIDELKNNKSSTLISPLNINTKLLDYKEENNVLYLNFNKYFLDKNEDTNKKIQEMIAYSVFDNYDIDMVMFEVNGKKVNYIEK